MYVESSLAKPQKFEEPSSYQGEPNDKQLKHFLLELLICNILAKARGYGLATVLLSGFFFFPLDIIVNIFQLSLHILVNIIFNSFIIICSTFPLILDI